MFYDFLCSDPAKRFESERIRTRNPGYSRRSKGGVHLFCVQNYKALKVRFNSKSALNIKVFNLGSLLLKDIWDNTGS